MESRVQEKGVGKTSQKMRVLKKFLQKILKNHPFLLFIDLGVSCPGEGDQKMSEFRIYL